MNLHQHSPLFLAQFVRTLGSTCYQGAEIGECFAIMSAIEPSDKEGWFLHWKEFAERNYERGLACQKNRQHVDAKAFFLRASSYFRTAYFFLEEQKEDRRIETMLQYSIDAFQKAIPYLPCVVEIIAIPYEDILLPAYFYHNPESKEPSPLLIDTGGGDGTKEESYFYSAVEAIQRGMHCLTFEGPGQGSVLRMQKKPFVPDWEKVVQAVMDYVLQRKEVISEKCILMGKSFGGYLATRAVTQEHRIAATIVDPGILQPLEGLWSRISRLQAESPEWRAKSKEECILHMMENDPSFDFMMRSRFMRFGANTLQELMINTRPFTLNGLLEDITCPMLVCDNEQEYITKGQAKKLYDALPCKKQYHLFTAQEGAGGHCQPTAPKLFANVMYSWLQERIG